MFAPAIALGLFATQAQTVPDSVVLQFKFKVGDKRHYKTHSEMEMLIHADEDEKTTISNDTDFTQTVDSIDAEGIATLASKFRSIQSTINGKVQPLDQKLIDTPGKVKVSSDGTVSQIKIPGQGATDPGLKLNEMRTSAQLPKEAVKVGSSWDSTVSLPSLGNVAIKNSLKSIDVVSGDTIATVVAEAPMDVSGMLKKMLPNAKISAKGTAIIKVVMIFDVTPGYVKSNHLETTFNFTMTSTDTDAKVPEVKETGKQTYAMDLVP